MTEKENRKAYQLKIAVKEVLDCAENQYPSKEPAYQELKRFLSNEMQMEETTVVDLIREIWNKISLGYDMHDIMDTLNDEDVCFPNEKAFMKFAEIIQNVNNHTRMLSNRGYMPLEMFELQKREGSLHQGGMPTIVPMSGMAAEMLKSSQQELSERGFTVDLDSNAQEISGGAMKNGLSGGMEMRSGKIYPNDPCPCGSGKKYKKCCGKN